MAQTENDTLPSLQTADGKDPQQTARSFQGLLRGGLRRRYGAHYMRTDLCRVDMLGGG